MAAREGNGDPGDPYQAEGILAIETGLCQKLKEVCSQPSVFINTSVAWVYNPRYHSKINPTGVMRGYMKVEGGSITHSDNPTDVENQLVLDDHKRFLNRFQGDEERVLLLGMNPGSSAGEQYSVAFADDPHPTSWLMGETGDEFNNWVENRTIEDGNSGAVFVKAITQTEVFGTTGGDFFTKKFFVYNYCPVSFLYGNGSVLALASITGELQKKLKKVCDEGLKELIKLLKITRVVAFGDYVMKRAKKSIGSDQVIAVPHPAASLKRHPKLTLKQVLEKIKNGMVDVMRFLVEAEITKLSRKPVVLEEDLPILTELKEALAVPVGTRKMRSVWLQVNKLVEKSKSRVDLPVHEPRDSLRKNVDDLMRVSPTGEDAATSLMEGLHIGNLPL